VRELIAAGAAVTLSTDDPGMFGAELNREYAHVARIAGLDEAGVARLARAGIVHSFAPDDVKRLLLAELDAAAR